MLKIGNRDLKVPFQRDDGILPQASPSAENVHPAKATVIGENISIEGVIKADEDIVIEGSLTGSIIVKSHKLIVGKSGRIEADIQAENVVLSGHMKGAIIAFNKVQINQSADFTGQIKAKSIAVEDGAILKASIELDKDIREKMHADSPHLIDATVYPAEGYGDKSKLHDVSQQTLIN
jgi:cytoskeletal protein CcmA (bactofilin family)